MNRSANPSAEPSTGRPPAWDGTHRVLVAIRHPAMRHLTCELLERECHEWVATEIETGQLREAIGRYHPDLIVADTTDFPACCRRALEEFPAERVIVIGPEPGPSYEHAALALGAGSWIARDRVGEDLGAEMRRVLGTRVEPDHRDDGGAVGEETTS